MAGQKITREFNNIGEKITIQLSYSDMEITKLPESCYECPVGYMCQSCGRTVPLMVDGRPDTCKLKEVRIIKEFANDKDSGSQHR